MQEANPEQTPQEQEKPSTPHWLDYKPGSKNFKGEEITSINSCNQSFAIYWIKGTIVPVWEHDRAKCPHSDQAAAITDGLLQRCFSSLPKVRWFDTMRIIAANLATALRANNTDAVLKSFIEAESYIDNILYELSHFRYLVTSLGVTLVFIIPPCLAYYIYGKTDIYQILVGAFFGSVGALVSVFQRFETITVPRHTTWRFTMLRAFSKIFIGGIFGAVFVIFHKAGLILNIIGANSYILYVFSFICGFSERYMPDLLDEIKSKVTPNIQKESPYSS